MEISQETLKGKLVTLEPINPSHLADFVEAGADPRIWEWMTFSLSSKQEVKGFIDRVSKMPARGQGVGYAIRSNVTNKIIGGSGFWHADKTHKKLEIGGSWLTFENQRTGANTESKYILLKQAFEQLGCKRVGFSIDTRNLKSISAISRIGAIQEGVIRSDLDLHDGRDRDSALYSVLASEWPKIKKNLESLIDSR